MEPYETKKPKSAIFNSAKNNHSDFISKCSDLGFSFNDTDETLTMTPHINSTYMDAKEFKDRKFNTATKTKPTIKEKCLRNSK